MDKMQVGVLAMVLAMYAVVILKSEWKVWASVVCAALMVATGVVGIHEAFFSMINWNVLMIYVGSMVIAEMFLYSKAPAVLADRIISTSKNVGHAIVAILVMTGIISAFVENVATVLVMAPICLALSKKLKMDPTYFMVGLAVMANLEGTATLVGDPPSMIFANYTGYGFNDFLFHEGRISICWFIQVGLLAGALYFLFHFRNAEQPPKVEGEKMVSWVPTILLLGMIFGLALCSFLQSGVGFLSGSFVLALGVVAALWYLLGQKKGKGETISMLRGLDWETIFFLAGIFVVVGGIENSGLLELLAGHMESLIGGNVLVGFILILLVSVLISGFVDNVPYIMVMLPVADQLGRGLGLAPELYMFALLIGSCLGGNLTCYGASANVVAVGILKKHGVPCNFGNWLKIGVPFTLLTTAASAVSLWLVWA
ncbi:MAG: SLC13 family permease [Sphaerochaetaceae bacterium]|nr:SLC13 family permease [Spirochaetales bacterium]MDY5498813.1 SLC13 family permease [Sphaerochaetaceae bacterium]